METSHGWGTALSRTELERHLIPGEPIRVAYVYSGTFATPLDHAGIEGRLAAGLHALPGATRVGLHDAPEPDRQVYVEFRGKPWAVGVARAPEQPGRWRVHITFREQGQAWGSNLATWRMLQPRVLAMVDAIDVVDDADE